MLIIEGRFRDEIAGVLHFRLCHSESLVGTNSSSAVSVEQRTVHAQDLLVSVSGPREDYICFKR